MGTGSPASASTLLTANTSSTYTTGIGMTLSGGGGTGINVTSASSSYNNITSTNSGNAAATYYAVGGLLTSATLSSASTFAKGYLGYKANGSTNVATNYYAGYFQGKTTVTSDNSPTSTSDLEVQNTTSGTIPATFSMRTTTQVTTPDASATLTERMRITNNGSVGIGTTSPSYKLEVCGTIGTTAVSVNTSITCSSDIRYKKNITPLPNALKSVMKLQGVNYFWKIKDFPEKQFTNTKQIGFIAQDIEKIYPEMVITDDKGFKSVDYSRLTPVLVEAIKEQQKEIGNWQLTVGNMQKLIEEIQKQNKEMQKEILQLKNK